MRHIKLFNENNELNQSIDELEKFCKDNLSYLTDDKFMIEVNKVNPSSEEPKHHNEKFSIKIRKENNVPFHWDNVKYDLMPFIQVISDKYSIVNSSVGLAIPFFNKLTLTKHKVISTKSLIDDSADIDEVLYIRIIVSKIKLNTNKNI
jgi:hypothetical protein